MGMRFIKFFGWGLGWKIGWLDSGWGRMLRLCLIIGTEMASYRAAGVGACGRLSM